jgi:hypothetical protein
MQLEYTVKLITNYVREIGLCIRVGVGMRQRDVS